MKRFTETTKWRDRWFYGLSGKHKLLWMWLCDNCDSAGVVEPEWNMVKTDTGFGYSDEDLKPLGERLEGLGKGKHLIVKFAPFQYGKLSAECRPHIPILATLAKHRLIFDSENQRVSKGYSEGIDTPKDTDKEKEQEKDQGIERVQREKGDRSKGTEKEVVEFCVEQKLPESDGRFMFSKWEGSGWRNGGNPIKNWKATIRSHIEGGYMPSQKNGKAAGRPLAGDTGGLIKDWGKETEGSFDT